jgi:uncharacterized membrane protein
LARLHLEKKFHLLVAIIFWQLLVYAVVLFDVPIARQIIVFSYIVAIPGFLFFKLLKIEGVNKPTTVALSIGFSIAIIMLVGLCINELGFLLGFSKPLSVLPLVVALNVVVLVETFLLSFFRKQNHVDFSVLKGFRVPYGIVLSVVILALAVIGAFYVNIFENNLLLLGMLSLIALVVVFGVLSEKFLPPRFYSLAILLIALSLLFHSSLISRYIVPFGSDVNQEIAVFNTVDANMYWNSSTLLSGYSTLQRVNVMLSVTVLPAVFSSLLKMDVIWIFKILTPLIFSVVPLILYEIWKGYVGARYAFLSSFLFIAQATFFTEMLGLNRQMIAELFFCLLLLIILNKEVKRTGKIASYIIFSIGLVLSHYAISEIFLLLISIVLISFMVLKMSSNRITLGMVLFFFVVMFSWYIYTSHGGVFNDFLSYGNYVAAQMGDFFNPASRGSTVLRGLGLEASPSLWNTLSRFFAYLTEGCIVVGFLGPLFKRAYFKVEEYKILGYVALAFLVSLIIVPGLSDTMNMTRFYHILLFFIAPMCVVGVSIIVSSGVRVFKPLLKILKHNEPLVVSVLSLIIIIPYFLFQTGFVYEVVQIDSWSLPLSKYRMQPLTLLGTTGYVFSTDVLSARWVHQNVEFQNETLCADMSALSNVITSQGIIFHTTIEILSNVTKSPTAVYLSHLNVREGFVVGEVRLWNTSEVSGVFGDLNMVYSNGDACFYRK